jgi:hypothetical protein
LGEHLLALDHQWRASMSTMSAERASRNAPTEGAAASTLGRAVTTEALSATNAARRRLALMLGGADAREGRCLG